MNAFKEVKKNFGFGCMRLPLKNGKVDYNEFSKMIDLYLAKGFNYFDTARVYLEGQSETALRDCLVKRYPRDRFIFTDKLSKSCFNQQEDIIPLFHKQLESCGLDYFDFYLLHAQNKDLFQKYKRCKAYETVFQLQKEGKIKHVGISFHDQAEVLDEILDEYPSIEVVQIQLNYVDYDDKAVQSRLCYEVCAKHNKPVIVMEPVKGGNLANLPLEAKKYIDELHGGSPASYAIRFAMGFKNVFMVLSGMSNLSQMEDNLSFAVDYKPLNEKEMEALKQVCKTFKSMHLIPCTGCRYCVDGCPKKIAIPNLFSCLNSKTIYHDWNANYYYNEVYTKANGKASSCIKCGRCEKSCPQHLPIRSLLEEVANEFEK